MLGVVKMPFGTLQKSYQKNEVVEILDWTWVSGGLVEPLLPEISPVEMATVKPGEVSVPARAKKKRLTADDRR